MNEDNIPVILEEAVRNIVQDEIQKALNSLNFRTQADRTIFQKNLQILDAKNIQLGKTNGTMIGTESLQKIGFYGVTPIIQQSAITAPTGGGTGSTDAIDITGRTAINAIRTALKNIGITK